MTMLATVELQHLYLPYSCSRMEQNTQGKFLLSSRRLMVLILLSNCFTEIWSSTKESTLGIASFPRYEVECDVCTA